MGSGRHAVVIGAGLAGLTSTATLAKHFDAVTVVERDDLPQAPAFRKGVPQSRHLHALMGGGQRALEELLPGFTDDLYAAGAVPLRTPFDHLWLSPAGWCYRFPPTHVVPSASREQVEWVVRDRVSRLSGVRFRDRAEAIDIKADAGAITAVRVRSRDNGAVEEIEADLVVDAAGRGSKSVQWLESLGYGTPERTAIDSRAGYSSRYYAVPEDFGDEWRIISIQPLPPRTLRGGALVPVEGGRWLVSLYGYLDDHPPTDDEGFLAFAAGLRHPVLYETIRAAKPLGPVHGYLRMANERIHYESLTRWPDRLLVLGDATCAVNPVYAQGMSMAAMTAVTLGRRLAERDGDVSDCGALQKEVAAGNERAWQTAVGADLGYLTPADAEVDEETRRGGEYMGRLLELAMVDPVVNKTFFDVMMMLDEPGALSGPEIAARISQGPRRPVSTDLRGAR
jgi:2-polyprenyl-6-methoxyphenol hydroxylase-like FAD-dependent oxidoreductase